MPFRGDGGAVGEDGEAQVGAVGGQCHLAAREAVLQCVVEQVAQDLGDGLAVDLCEHSGFDVLLLKPFAAQGVGWLEALHRVAQQFADVDRLQLRVQLARVDLLEVQELRGEVEQAVGVLVDDAQVVGYALVIDARILDDLEGPADEGEGRANFVGNLGEVLYALLAQFLLLLDGEDALAFLELAFLAAAVPDGPEADEGSCGKDVEHDGPPLAPQRRAHDDGEGAFVVGCAVAHEPRRAQPECIAPRPQVGQRQTAVGHGMPLGVERLEAVLVGRLEAVAVGEEGDVEADVGVLEWQGDAVGLHDAALERRVRCLRRHLLSVDAESCDEEVCGHGGRLRLAVGRELVGMAAHEAVDGSEEKGAGRQRQRGLVVELVAGQALRGGEQVDAPRGGVELYESSVGAEPESLVAVLEDVVGHVVGKSLLGVETLEVVALSAVAADAAAVCAEPYSPLAVLEDGTDTGRREAVRVAGFGLIASHTRIPRV